MNVNGPVLGGAWSGPRPRGCPAVCTTNHWQAHAGERLQIRGGENGVAKGGGGMAEIKTARQEGAAQHMERDGMAWKEERRGREDVDGTAGVKGDGAAGGVEYYAAYRQFSSKNMVRQCQGRQ